MPLVRISMLKGSTTEFKQKISQSVHQSLIDIFGIPEDDLFQVIEELDKGNIIFPQKYMGIPHTEKIIMIQIIAKHGRSTKIKQALYQAIVDRVEQSTEHNCNDLIITLVENDKANWSFARLICSTPSKK